LEVEPTGLPRFFSGRRGLDTAGMEGLWDILL